MEKRELSEKELREKKLSLAKGTKYLLDFMFYAGILVTISLPLSLKYIGKYLEAVEEHYLPAVIIFVILGVLALLLVNELRKMFGTVLAENCFVPENVASLRRMGDLSFFIAAMSADTFKNLSNLILFTHYCCDCWNNLFFSRNYPF